MEYGCIGQVLKHSFSKMIHEFIAEYSYSLTELQPHELESFMSKADFKAINVTIPYKEAVIPYLHEIDESARLIGAVNTVVNRGGRLYGYNTDFFGMKSLISFMGISLLGKKVLILGTGGTSKTAMAVAKNLGAGEIIRASRSDNNAAVLYTDIYKFHDDAEIIINTTPVGMFPKNEGTPIDISKFKKLCGVVDVVYNPGRTRLILDAEKRGIPAMGGLYMLVAQAVRASEIFLDKSYSQDTLFRAYKKVLSDTKSIVLIGMPASGKSTVGAYISEMLSREFIDTDGVIEAVSGKKITEIFKEGGEEAFRNIECDVIRDVSKRVGVIVSTGGGAVLRDENIESLGQNGKIYFIDRPLKHLIPTEDRPLSKTKEDIERRYSERYSTYCRAADVIIDADAPVKEVAEKIISDFLSE